MRTTATTAGDATRTTSNSAVVKVNRTKKSAKPISVDSLKDQSSSRTIHGKSSKDHNVVEIRAEEEDSISDLIRVHTLREAEDAAEANGEVVEDTKILLAGAKDLTKVHMKSSSTRTSIA